MGYNIQERPPSCLTGREENHDAPPSAGTPEGRDHRIGGTAMPQSITLKTCRICGTQKPLSEFHRDKSKKDGRRNECKPCKCADVRARRNPERERRWRSENADRVRENGRRWRQQNRDKVLASKARHRERKREELAAKQRARYAKDPDKHRREGREYARAHRDEATARHRQWRQNNREHVRRYGRISVLLHKFSRDEETQRYIILLRHDPCSYCGAPPESAIDHIIPVSKGGSGKWWNLTAACKRCNSSKKDRSLLRFLLDA